jgi:excisionase family DNA binding protein
MPADDNAAFDLLTIDQVAEVLHCSKAHICNLMAGRVSGCSPLPALRLGRRMLVRRQSLASWIAQNEARNGNLEAPPERDRLKSA